MQIGSDKVRHRPGGATALETLSAQTKVLWGEALAERRQVLLGVLKRQEEVHTGPASLRSFTIKETDEDEANKGTARSSPGRNSQRQSCRHRHTAILTD